MKCGLWVFLLLASLSFSAHAGSEKTLSPQGLGAIKVGMSLEEAKKASQQNIETHDEMSGSDGCSIALIKEKGEYVVEMLLEKEKIQRISLIKKNGAHTTVEGAKVGDSETHLKEIYKDSLTVEPHAYDESGHYFKTKDKSAMGYMFETDGKNVTKIHAGRYPAVGYVEGCL